ncbi:glycosyltransferase family 2 protein, partial [Vibrio cholerae]
MVSNNVTLVIPTYNMSTHIFGLWNSINTSNLIEYISEIIFVNDGSTDDTLQVLTSLKKNDTRNIIKILNLESNQGRFMARYLGVLEANSSQILFLDSRIELPNNFGYELSVAIRDYPNIVGSVDIDTTRNAFCLYWDRTHKKIFKKHYDDANDVIVLDEDNYDSYLKGTTVFFCQKENFISSCSKYKDTPLLNDDTYLMKDMVRSQPIAIHPKVRITWVPRENLKDFLVRMWERGPSFVEYHLFSSRGI